MSNLRELYQEVIVDHSQAPRNCYKMTAASQQAQGFNPLCGDKITVFLQVNSGIIEDVSFEGCGCAISIASASLMTEQLKGKTEQQAQQLFTAFHELMTQQSSDTSQLGKLTVLESVQDFPTRIKCATLAWHTFKAALDKCEQEVSTE